ncbi:MAG: DoxX family protein [Acidobacteria bacterium]|nr:DoxX family protein [Acidobacteriota bacterium]
MKNRINGFYWVVTGLMAAFMLMASIPDVLRLPQAIEIFGHLGYPAYLLPFLGTAKILGVFAVLMPGFDRLKEWAYAGLVFDITGALYSHLSVGDPVSVWGFAVIALVLVGGSYVVGRLRTQERSIIHADLAAA